MKRLTQSPLPPLGGGQDLDEVLAELSAQITALGEREAKGENVADEKAKLEAEAKAARDAKAAAKPEDELTRLRRESREREERETASAAVKAAMTHVTEQESARQERIKAYAMDAVRGALGGHDDVDAAVQAAMKSVRGPSRFVSEHASDQELATVASGGGIKTAGRVTVGQSREAKELQESRSLTKFVAAVHAMKQGLATDGQREFLMAQHTKALAEGTGSAGGFLAPTEWMDDVLPLLRARTVVRAANPRFQRLGKIMYQTSVSSGASAFYTAENARITPSEPTFAEAALLTPKNLTGLVPVSNYILWDGDHTEDVVKSDLTEVLGLREDLAFLQGTGGTEPTGLKNISGITSDPIAPGTNGFQPTNRQIRQIIGATRLLNASGARWTWFFTPAFLTYVENLLDADGRFLMDTTQLMINEDQASGKLFGVPFYTSTQIPANITRGTSTTTTYLMLVNQAETVIGDNHALEISVSDQANYTSDGGTTWRSAFQENQTLFKAVMRHDIAHRRPNQILVQNGVIV